MMGRIVSMTKRWWIVAVVFTLALSLTSCSRRQNLVPLAEYGFGFCDGTIGSFDVYVIKNRQDPNLFDISIIPVALNAPGDIVSITVANQNLAYRELVTQVVLFNDTEIRAGTLSTSELAQFDILAITPYQPGVTFLEVNSAQDALCDLPLPGDGVNNQTTTSRSR